MKSWTRYQQRFLGKAFSLELKLVEKSLLVAMLGVLVLNGAFVFVGRNVGDMQQIRLAKLQAEQGVMAAQNPEMLNLSNH